MAKYYSGKYIRSRGRTAWVAIAVVVAVTVLALILSTLGKAIAENLLAPAFGQAQQSVTPLPQGYKNGMIILPRLDLYTVQLCTFDDQVAASAASDALRQKGGAGYIYKDSKLRLLASGYTTEAQARSVADKQAQQDYAPAVFVLSSGSISFVLSCKETDFTVIQNACSYYPELVKELTQEAISAEMGTMTQTAVKIKYASRATQLRQTVSALESIPSDANIPLINQLLTLYRNAIVMLEKISSQNFEYSVDFFAEIRYNYIEMACEYCQAMKNLS